MPFSSVIISIASAPTDGNRVLPPTTVYRTVHLLGSWDNYTTAQPMEQDSRVGRGVWKGMITEGGGLEMGAIFKYYFIIDSKHCIPDPSSTEDLTMIDHKTGRLVSILHVPILVPQSSDTAMLPPPPPHAGLRHRAPTSAEGRELSISPASVIGSSVFVGGEDVQKYFEEPRQVPSHPPKSKMRLTLDTRLREKGSLRNLLREKSSLRSLSVSSSSSNKEKVNVEENGGKRRKWSIGRKASFFRTKKIDDERTPAPSPAKDSEETGLIRADGGGILLKRRLVRPSPDGIAEIAGYLRQKQNRGSHHQPAKTYYQPPVNTNTYSSMASRHPQPLLPRNISDTSRSNGSTETMGTNITSCSITTSNCSCNCPPACTCTSELQSSFSPDGTASVFSEAEDDDDEGFEVDTPVDGLGISASNRPNHQVYQPSVGQRGYAYPKYYNFDELQQHGVPGGNRDIGRYVGDVMLRESASGGASYVNEVSMKPLGCLREEVAGELAWREELAQELGYLGGVVV